MTRQTHWTRNRRHVVPGTELSVRGERGRFRFHAYVTNAKGSTWVDVYGGPEGRPMWRSFAPDRITRVHRTTKGRVQ